MNRATQDTGAFGLLATGRSGAWTIDVDERLAGDELWSVQIEGPTVYLSFDLAGPNVLGAAMEFLDRSRVKSESSPGAPAPELILGHVGAAPVTLVRDNEGERWFLVIGPESQCCVRLSLFAEDVDAIRDALRQVQHDLSQNDIATAPAQPLGSQTP